jgi:hypothetical protein
LAPLEIDHRDEPRLAHLVEGEVERLRCISGARVGPGDGLGPRLRAAATGVGRGAALCRHDDAPGIAIRLERSAPALPALERLLQRQLDLGAGEAREVAGAAQRPVESGRRDLEPLVGDALDLEDVLQLAVTRSQSSTVIERSGAPAGCAGWSIVTRSSPPAARSTSTRS